MKSGNKKNMRESPVLLKIEKLNTKSPFEFFENRKNRKKRGFFKALPQKCNNVR